MNQKDKKIKRMCDVLTRIMKMKRKRERKIKG